MLCHACKTHHKAYGGQRSGGSNRRKESDDRSAEEKVVTHTHTHTHKESDKNNHQIAAQRGKRMVVNKVPKQTGEKRAERITKHLGGIVKTGTKDSLLLLLWHITYTKLTYSISSILEQ
jgi:hypothetical protein